MIWVKLCGTTNVHDAMVGIAAGADALGFIFAPSPRQIAVPQAAEIAAAIGNQAEKIGVFVNQAPEVVTEIAEEVGLTGVQLHGDEPAMFMPKLRRLLGNRKIIKTLHAEELVDGGRQKLQLGEYLGHSRLFDAILLDSGSPERRGGTGAAFAWESALPIAQTIQSYMPLIIAGGLTAENVHEAIRLFKPWGVDVVSGVEAKPGMKDGTKLNEFMAAVRAVNDRVHAR